MLINNFSKLMALAIILLLPFSCAKEEANLTPHLEIASESASGFGSASESGSANHRDDGPDECRCKMRVNSTEGADPYDPSNPGSADLWLILDVTGSTSEIFEGAGNHWKPTPATPYAPLPSDFRSLNAPSDGLHTFDIYYFGDTPTDFILHTEVRCYRVDNGVETLATTTYHSFDLNQSPNYEFGNPSFGDFCRNFACKILAAGEDECQQTGTGTGS